MCELTVECFTLSQRKKHASRHEGIEGSRENEKDVGRNRH